MINSVLEQTKDFICQNGIDVDKDQGEKQSTTLTLPVIQAQVKTYMREFLQKYRGDDPSSVKTLSENVQSCQFLFEDNMSRGRTPVSRGSHVRGQI